MVFFILLVNVFCCCCCFVCFLLSVYPAGASSVSIYDHCLSFSCLASLFRAWVYFFDDILVGLKAISSAGWTGPSASSNTAHDPAPWEPSAKYTVDFWYLSCYQGTQNWTPIPHAVLQVLSNAE